MTAPTLDLDPRRRRVVRGGHSVRLGPVAFRIVELLARSPDGLEREALLERVYAHRDDGGPVSDSLSATLSTLRRKLAPLGLQIPCADRWLAVYRLTAGEI
jgi:DNA-binding response OmpR family regulator